MLEDFGSGASVHLNAVESKSMKCKLIQANSLPVLLWHEWVAMLAEAGMMELHGEKHSRQIQCLRQHTRLGLQGKG